MIRFGKEIVVLICVSFASNILLLLSNSDRMMTQTDDTGRPSEPIHYDSSPKIIALREVDGASSRGNVGCGERCILS